MKSSVRNLALVVSLLAIAQNLRGSAGPGAGEVRVGCESEPVKIVK
jgi:hypothetical protein